MTTRTPMSDYEATAAAFRFVIGDRVVMSNEASTFLTPALVPAIQPQESSISAK